MLPVYILSLAFSSGVVAAVVRKILQGFGFVPTLEASLVLTLGLAGLFAATQLAYVAFVRLATPSRGTGPLFFESLSNAAALVFLPYLAGLSFIPLLKARLHGGGGAILEKATEKLGAGLLEPVVLIAAFLAAHFLLKMLSFFSATESRPAGRVPAFIWAGLAVLCGGGGLLSLKEWAVTLDAARQVPLGDAKPVAIDGAYANARSLALGVDYHIPLATHGGETITLGWALAREYEITPTELHVTVSLNGGVPFQKTVLLTERGWAELRPFTEPLPEGATECIVSWDFAQESAWALKWGVRRPPSSSDVVWVSGPDFAAPAVAKSAPNFVVLAMDGVSTARMKSQGYTRDVLPVLDNLAKSAMFFPACVPPAPEAAASCVTLLTGLSPLEHGFLGKREGPLPATVKTLAEMLHEQHYATAAFTEADWRNRPDLGFATGIERGFDRFDPTTPLDAKGKGTLPGAPAPPEHAGSEITLDRAANWAELHEQDRFFLFVRLREAGAPALLARYGDGFVANRAKPDPGDVCDTALSAVDKALPAFLDRLKAKGLSDKTVIVITAPFGVEPEQGNGRGSVLTDASLMVPLLIIEPGKPGKVRNAMAGLEDVAPTLLRMLDPPVRLGWGHDLRDYTAESEHVSMHGDPLVLSLRNRRWRFTLDTGLDPFTRAQKADAAPVCLINIEQSHLRRTLVDDLGRFSEEVGRGRDTLLKYLDEHKLSTTP